jgi:hypothetical protein
MLCKLLIFRESRGVFLAKHHKLLLLSVSKQPSLEGIFPL